MFVLRDLSPADAGWIFEACQDSEIQRWTLVPRPYTREHAEDFAAHGAGEKRVWVVERSADHRGVGVIGVHTVIDGVADIGYWIAPWGRRAGAGSTAVRLVTDELSAWDDVTSITARIAVTNIASQATVRRVGFVVDPDGPATTCPDGECQVDAVTFRYVVR
ncbi:MAG: GNAT family N-acetyltransferase [Actinobacteria bacterium]|nr:GNAT family N-acetyltransferase [Actinomycetota bacterium]